MINMNLKRIVKNFLGFCRCIIAGVPYPGDVYVGRHVHIENGKRIALGRNVSIRPDVDLFAGCVFKIGEGCDIGTRNRIAGNVVIEDYVLFGPDNYICSEDHCFSDIQRPIMHQDAVTVTKNGHDELKIGSGSWIGTHVAIIGDVHIGKNCVIGANSVVTKDVPDYCVAVGIPARIVKRYNKDTNAWEKVSE